MNPAANLSLPYDYWRNTTTLTDMIKRHVIMTGTKNVSSMKSFTNVAFANQGANCTVQVGAHSLPSLAQPWAAELAGAASPG